MSIKIGINGLGRIGRMVIRSLVENKNKNIEIRHINNRTNSETSSLLLKYDSVHGKFNSNINYNKNNLIISKKKISFSQETELSKINWKKYGVDIVLECTGKYNSKEKCIQHIKNGAKKVIVSAPCKNADKTIVYGVNHKTINKNDLIISAASCTTNCFAPVAFVINKEFKIEKGFMTTIHSYTSDQRLLDNSHKDPRRARSAGQSIVPTSTGASKALGEIIPELKGKLDGLAIRVPTPNVSLLDFVFNSKNKLSVKKINDSFIKASNKELKNVLDTTNERLVSVDFNHNPNSAIVDLSLTSVVGDNMGKVSTWYDNEWGFASRMNDLVEYIHKV
jgi:glyceraldehyde 3-phosphate dehydrogenase